MLRGNIANQQSTYLIHQINESSDMRKLLQIKRVCETRMPPVATNSNSGKISVLHFDTTLPPGACDVNKSVHKQPLDVLSVQVWLLYHCQNFKYWILRPNVTIQIITSDFEPMQLHSDAYILYFKVWL